MPSEDTIIAMEWKNSIIFETLLEQLSEIEVDQIPIIEKLKQTARSGKAVRFDRAGLRLPKRSVYDHIISLPAQARFFIFETKIQIDVDQLDCMILFHDLTEALIGDTPSFTAQDIAQETFRSFEEKERAEEKASERLLAALPKALKVHFEDYLNCANSPAYRFFQMVDKTDPIIAVWRYIALHRSTLDIHTYLAAMTDFFLNPEVQRCCINERALAIVRVLQSKECASDYFKNGTFPSLQLKSLIEDRTMHDITSKAPSVA
ncbi:MAG: HD domain-containing protein [Parachlamydia sp.]|nr:HD domain-containing protein [Parachlamydia sp.]